MRGVDAAVDDRDRDRRVAERARGVDVAQHLPGIGRADHGVIPLLWKQEVVGRDGILLRRAHEIRLGIPDAGLRGEGVEDVQDAVAAAGRRAQHVGARQRREALHDLESVPGGELRGVDVIGQQRDDQLIGEEGGAVLVERDEGARLRDRSVDPPHGFVDALDAVVVLREAQDRDAVGQAQHVGAVESVGVLFQAVDLFRRLDADADGVEDRPERHADAPAVERWHADQPEDEALGAVRCDGVGPADVAGVGSEPGSDDGQSSGLVRARVEVRDATLVGGDGRTAAVRRGACDFRAGHRVAVEGYDRDGERLRVHDDPPDPSAALCVRRPARSA